MLKEDVTTAEDLKEAVRSTLDRKGITQDLKARLRASVFGCLEEKDSEKILEKPHDVYLASELIKEYLISLKLDNTLSVFSHEGGQPPEMRCDREFVGGELGFNVSELNDNIPLLVMLVRHLRQAKEKYDTDMHSNMAVEDDT